MLKVVIDTNVLVSSLIQRNYPHFVLREILLNESIQICISRDVWQEYTEVLSRGKFQNFIDFRENSIALLRALERKGIFYSPSQKLSILMDDDDNKFLELARESNAEFLITGNFRHFNLPEFEGTKIVSPKSFWDDHRSNKKSL